ncbi:MAG: histidine phosphatase family protein [Actinomycetota bacterium]|nr:histidine phosphatase family protein [Actinomycetota bacterium]
MSRLVLVRHGESEWNVERRIQGQSGTGLTGRGREQAQRTAELLAAAYPDALLVSSDLQRCLESVASFEELLGREAKTEPGLRERHFGEWTGRLNVDVAEEDPERWKRWRAGEDVFEEVGGENSATLARRAVATIRRLLEEAAGRPVVCMTHGGPVWHGVHALLRLHDRVLGGVANASVTEINVESVAPRLISWNQVVHLPLELRMVKRAAGGPPTGEVSSPPTKG